MSEARTAGWWLQRKDDTHMAVLGPNAEVIARAVHEPYARQIVTAVNAHDALLAENAKLRAALRLAIPYIEQGLADAEVQDALDPSEGPGDGCFADTPRADLEQARAALAEVPK